MIILDHEAVSVNSNNSGGNTSSAAAISADTQSALRHNPGISLDWDPEEQTMLEDLLVKFASDSTIVRYAKIAKQLKDKTVREVALLCRWMSVSWSFQIVCFKRFGSNVSFYVNVKRNSWGKGMYLSCFYCRQNPKSDTFDM
ncbi:uncharacterized protein LOC120165466 [Hibiscus syriacus]|uniref:uncharacterized protein LOC120165466 n=1 Tax=Hibiscus syriacus TaxID=106335 RepID=UPI001921D8CC|nr:uncharacterized protein LOC120165466 [Hibiscus syriacus]